MLKVFVCVLLIAVAVSADYDFNDSDFNELLFDDLRADFDDDFEETLRVRRDAEVVPEPNGCKLEKMKKDFHCCSDDKVDERQIEILREVKKQCIMEARGGAEEELSFNPFDCARMQAMKAQLVCTAECIAKKLNLMDENGVLKRDALLTHLRAKFGENKWKSDALEGYVDKCFAELKASATENKTELKISSENKDAKAELTISIQKKACGQTSLQFTHCIWREFVLGCPAESRVDSGKCSKIRQRLEKGDTGYLHKSFLHHLRVHHENREAVPKV